MRNFDSHVNLEACMIQALANLKQSEIRFANEHVCHSMLCVILWIKAQIRDDLPGKDA